MNFFIVIGTIGLITASFLIICVVIVTVLKFIKNNLYPDWKFPDYISVGYAEYLYKKYKKGKEK